MDLHVNMANRLIKQKCLMIPFFLYVGGKFVTSTSINFSLWLVSDNCTPRCRSISCSLKMCTTFPLLLLLEKTSPCFFFFFVIRQARKGKPGLSFNWYTTKPKVAV